MSWVTSLHALSTPTQMIKGASAGCRLEDARREPWSMQHHAPCGGDGTSVWEPHGSQRRTSNVRTWLAGVGSSAVGVRGPTGTIHSRPHCVCSGLPLSTLVRPMLRSSKCSVYGEHAFVDIGIRNGRSTWV